MRPNDVYVKTDKGNDEVLHRANKLPNILRTLLIMTDGRTNAGDLLKRTASLKTSEESIDQLVAGGYIARSAAPAGPQAAPAASGKSSAAVSGSEQERLSFARRFMNESAVNASGLRSFTFTLRLEKCENLGDLRSLLPEYVQIIEKGVGGVEAEVLISKVKEMLA